MKKYNSIEEWQKEAERLFGKDTKQWKFECPMCHTIQTPKDLIDTGMTVEEMQGYVGFSCIGRFTKEKGCDWTLGGLFRIHTVEIKTDKGFRPYFDFAYPQPQKDYLRTIDGDVVRM